jgi:hypothetical protein
MTPHALTVLVPVCPGQEEALRAVLRRIGDDIRGKELESNQPYVDFSRTRTHFARFVLLPALDCGPGRWRLLFAAIHDGEREGYLAELVSATRGMDAIWGACEGYRGARQFPAFIDEHSVEPNAFYIAYRGQTLDDVHQLAQRSRDVDGAAGRGDGGHDLQFPGGDGIGRFFKKTLSVLRNTAAGVKDALQVLWRHGFWNSLGAAFEIAASLNRIRILRLLNWITRNRMAPLTTNYSQLSLDGCNECVPGSERDEVVDAREQWRLRADREDQVAQNQLTLVMITDAARLRRLQAVMAVIGLYSRRLSKPGLLAGISTIHFVRWVIIDDGKRLVTISDYDGSWEAYIEEFAEMILSGLDAIWSGSQGFPRNGARDLQAFKRFLRCRQYQADLFYSGYPRETVLNILLNRELLASRRTAPSQVKDVQ